MKYKIVIVCISVLVILVSIGYVQSLESEAVSEVVYMGDSDFFGSRGKSYNVLDQYYKQVLKKNPDAKEMVEDWKILRNKVAKEKRKYDKYENLGKHYYKDAKAKQEHIKDETMKNKVATAIDKGKARFDEKTNNFHDKVNQLKQMEQTLKDNENTLKILWTIPYLEQKQDELKIDNQIYNDLVKEYERLIEASEKMVLKH